MWRQPPRLSTERSDTPASVERTLLSPALLLTELLQDCNGQSKIGIRDAPNMHIDYENLTIETESDVEQKILMPLLQGEAYLGIAESNIFTKQYHAPTALDKSAGKTSGYFPDYGIWIRGFLVMAVEAKTPDVSVETGYREAALYARHINQNYPTEVNPCRFVLACNGKQLLFGYWDSMPILSIDLAELRVGSIDLDRLQQGCAYAVLESHAIECLRHLRSPNPTFPYNLIGGPAVLNSKLAVNQFAADLSPILRRYFSSGTPDNSQGDHRTGLRQLGRNNRI